jgi:hypothetical protein
MKETKKITAVGDIETHQVFLSNSGTIFSSSFPSSPPPGHQEGGKQGFFRELNDESDADLLFKEGDKDTTSSFTFDPAPDENNNDPKRSDSKSQHSSSTWNPNFSSDDDSKSNTLIRKKVAHAKRQPMITLNRNQRYSRVEEIEDVPVFQTKSLFDDDEEHSNSTSSVNNSTRRKSPRCVKIFCKPQQLPTPPTTLPICEDKDRDVPGEIKLDNPDDDDESFLSRESILPQDWKNGGYWDEVNTADEEKYPEPTFESSWNWKPWNYNNSHGRKIETGDSRGDSTCSNPGRKKEVSFVKSSGSSNGENQSLFYKIWRSAGTSNSLIDSECMENESSYNGDMEEEYDEDSSTEYTAVKDVVEAEVEAEVMKRKRRKFWKQCFIKHQIKGKIEEESEKQIEEEEREDQEETEDRNVKYDSRYDEQDPLSDLVWMKNPEMSDEDFFTALFWPNREEGKEPKPVSTKASRNSCVGALSTKPIRNESNNRSQDPIENENKCMNKCIKPSPSPRKFQASPKSKKTKSNSNISQKSCVKRNQNENNNSKKQTANPPQKKTSVKETNCTRQKRETIRKKETHQSTEIVSQDDDETNAIMKTLAKKFYDQENAFLDKLEELFLGPDNSGLENHPRRAN